MKDIGIRCLTWNVATSAPPTNIEELQPLISNGAKGDIDCDVFVLGLQEVSSLPLSYFSAFVRGEDDWGSAFTQLLNCHGFVKVESIRVLGTVIALFVHLKHLDRLRDVETQYLRLTTEGFKASVAIRFRLYGVSVCLLNSHLSAHDYNYELRLDEYERTLEGMKFKQDLTNSILYHDYIFWMGDLNFRIDADPKETESYILKNDLKILSESDQLDRAMKDQKAFHDLQESRPTFVPTYKFVKGSNDYDLKRCPSWTDRILYRCNSHNYEHLSNPLKLTQVTYDSHMSVTLSDHKPVSSEFLIDVFEDLSQMAKNTMDFGPVIDFHSVDDAKVDADLRVIYEIKQGSSDCLKQWDWIGLYKAGVKDLARYVSFSWASECRLSNVSKSVLILGDTFTKPGDYCLVYVSANKAVLGVSQVFHMG